MGLALAVPAGFGIAASAHAANSKAKPPIDCHGVDAPYKDYNCLDAYLGDGFLERFVNYYKLEWGHEGPPADPKAPRRVARAGRMLLRQCRHIRSPSGPTAVRPQSA